jgi:hypothetical protein
MTDTETARSIAQQLQQHSFESGPLNEVKEPEYMFSCNCNKSQIACHEPPSSKKEKGWEITT